MKFQRRASGDRARQGDIRHANRRGYSRAVATSLLLLSSATAAYHKSGGDRRQLLQVEARWNEAIRTGDANHLRKLLAADFELIYSPARTVDVAEVIGTVSKRAGQITENGSRDQNVRIYGDAAVITGVYFEKGLTSSQSYTFEARYTDVYVRQNGEWLAVSAHSSPSPPVMKPRN